jgi:hypothetical protein
MWLLVAVVAVGIGDLSTLSPSIFEFVTKTLYYWPISIFWTVIKWLLIFIILILWGLSFRRVVKIYVNLSTESRNPSFKMPGFQFFFYALMFGIGAGLFYEILSFFVLAYLV